MNSRTDFPTSDKVQLSPDTHRQRFAGCDIIIVLNSRGSRVVLGPDSDVLVEVMRPEDRRVASQVVEIVHDDSDEQIQHLATQRNVTPRKYKVDSDRVPKHTKCSSIGLPHSLLHSESDIGKILVLGLLEVVTFTCSMTYLYSIGLYVILFKHDIKLSLSTSFYPAIRIEANLKLMPVFNLSFVNWYSLFSQPNWKPESRSLSTPGIERGLPVSDWHWWEAADLTTCPLLRQ